MHSTPKPLIYLASASPRRSALLNQIGVTHRILPVDVDESVLPQETPHEYVQRLAAHKAARCWQQLPAAERLPVLGADTTVAIDGEILGKPASEAECVRMLTLLSGRKHQVLTAVALQTSYGAEVRLSVSDVTFRPLQEAEMRGYWHSGEPHDKAGGYAVQGRAALFIEHIAGSYSGIVGLPLFETGVLLATIGWSAFPAGGEHAMEVTR